jgi:hypothetical protein
MRRTMECPRCGHTVEAIDMQSEEAAAAATLYGPEPGARIRQAREFRFDPGTAALHHVCSDRQVFDPEWWPEASWWACQEAERQLDEDVKYELNCGECARRHVGGRRN